MRKFLRDPASGLIHLGGALLGVLGFWFLMLRSQNLENWIYLVSFAVFSVSLVLMYLASSAYHLIVAPLRLQKILRQLDHSMIFVFIAGTYTPFCLISLKGTIGLALLFTVWIIAFVGAVTKVFWMHAPRWISTAIYVGMGWLVVIAVVPLIRTTSVACFLWLAIGGLCYTIGSVVYVVKRPDPFPLVFGFHEIWHLFVLAGSVCQFVSVALLIP